MMIDFEVPVATAPLVDPGANEVALARDEAAATLPVSPPVDPVRSAAGRLGGKRVHQLAELGRVYESEHGLKAGRQRLKQLIQLGVRYEIEHGLRSPAPRRRQAGDAWQEFIAALARVVKPAYRPAVEQLVNTLRAHPEDAAPNPLITNAA